MTEIKELTAKLKAAAQKATALNLDTAQIKRGHSGDLECPCCEGAGYVEEESDFCNIDGVALGVQFYGIGPHHGLAEEYLRMANPANILALTEALEAAEKRISELEARTLTVKLPPRAPDNLGSVLDGYEKWLIATTFRDTWNACLSEVTRVNAAGIKLQIEGE